MEKLLFFGLTDAEFQKIKPVASRLSTICTTVKLLFLYSCAKKHQVNSCLHLSSQFFNFMILSLLTTIRNSGNP